MSYHHEPTTSGPHSPSHRTSDISTHNNIADCIERFLREDSHHIWGFVIYRCTYDSDADWQEFMKYYRAQLEKSLKSYNGLDLLDGLRITVFDDKETFDDAFTMDVREHFKEWTKTAPEEEQGGRGEREGVIGESGSQRYRYCVQVDEEALESVINLPAFTTATDGAREGHVNLIWRDWETGPIVVRGDDGEVIRTVEREEEEDEDEIEGCKLHDVGWMMVGMRHVGLGVYYYLRDLNAWYIEYRRPPQVTMAWMFFLAQFWAVRSLHRADHVSMY